MTAADLFAVPDFALLYEPEAVCDLQSTTADTGKGETQ